MSEDDDGYSRRQILGAVMGVGVGGLSAGAATRAYLVDRSTFRGNRLQAGAFTLELAGTAATDSDQSRGFPSEHDFESGETLSVDFPDLEPGDEGVFTAAYRLCENPGRVWLRTRLVGAGDTDLEDHLDVRVSTRPNCDSGAVPQFDGTLGAFHEAFSGGASLECRYVGKVEYDDDAGEFSIEEEGTVTSREPPTFEFPSAGGEPVEIELTDVQRNDEGEVVEFDYEVVDGSGLCEVIVAGGADPGSGSTGPEKNYYTYECASADAGLTPPENDNADGVHGLSHVEFYACDDCHGCVPGCLDLEWEFDDDPPEDLLDDSLRLELEFLAVQCRHRSEPNNPWN